MLIILVSCFVACSKEPPANEAMVRIDAAASIAHVIETLAEPVYDDLGVHIEVNSGASGTLAQQIVHGDKADIFISADPMWIDRLTDQNLIDKPTRVSLVANRLVLIGRTDLVTMPGSLEDLSQTAFQPIAIGDPAYVPAGRYAVQTLNAHGLQIGPELEAAEAPNVRAALAYVKSGQCPVGLVYASDALGESGVAVLLTINPTDHDPIVYPAAILTAAPEHDQAIRVLGWLRGEKARAAFDAAGFGVP